MLIEFYVNKELYIILYTPHIFLKKWQILSLDLLLGLPEPLVLEQTAALVLMVNRQVKK